MVLQDLMTDFPVSPTLLRVVRVFRIGRILRLIKVCRSTWSNKGGEVRRPPSSPEMVESEIYRINIFLLKRFYISDTFQLKFWIHNHKKYSPPPASKQCAYVVPPASKVLVFLRRGLLCVSKSNRNPKGFCYIMFYLININV